jgi:branched-chain amino acid aminotransferase
VPVELDIEQARNSNSELIQANGVSAGRVRITALRGEAGAWSREQAADGELIIFTSSDQLPPPRDAAITMSPYRVLSHGPLAGVKRTAMLDNVLALEEARSRGFAEAVMFNERGEIVGATAANIFWSEGEEIITPSLGTGCVAGVTRALVLEIARRERIPVVEGGFPVQRLLEADRVFLTSTVKEITFVSEFDHKRYNRTEWSSAQRIEREFQKLTRNARITR